VKEAEMGSSNSILKMNAAIATEAAKQIETPYKNGEFAEAYERYRHMKEEHPALFEEVLHYLKNPLADLANQRMVGQFEYITWERQTWEA
jgi:hypothetical protein